MTNKKPLLSKESAKVAQSETYFDNRKLLTAFPSFIYTPLKDAVQKSCEAYTKKYRQLVKYSNRSSSRQQKDYFALTEFYNQANLH